MDLKEKRRAVALERYRLKHGTTDGAVLCEDADGNCEYVQGEVIRPGATYLPVDSIPEGFKPAQDQGQGKRVFSATREGNNVVAYMPPDYPAEANDDRTIPQFQAPLATGSELDLLGALVTADRQTKQVFGVPHYTPKGPTLPILATVAETLKAQSRYLSEVAGHNLGDRRYHFAHLATEEVGELLEGLAEGNPEKVLDAIADLQYILNGNAGRMGLNAAAALVEVIRSNGTKERQPDDPEGFRVRSKGPNYQPPRIAEILKRDGYYGA